MPNITVARIRLVGYPYPRVRGWGAGGEWKVGTARDFSHGGEKNRQRKRKRGLARSITVF